MTEPISESTVTRLNALMRPADGTSNYAINAGILAAITDAGGEAERVAALAYVFATKPFARWSGPATPASEYPAKPDFEGRDRAAFETLQRDKRLPRQLLAFVAQISADEADVPERAKRAWAFIATQCPTPMAKVTALAAMLQDGSPFLDDATPPTGLRFEEVIPNEECNQIRWRNRTVMARLNGICTSDAIKQKATTGAAVLAALSDVPDERDRAFILGAFISDQRRGGLSIEALALDLPFPHGLAEALSAALRGDPCPGCGEVHGADEHTGG